MTTWVRTFGTFLNWSSGNQLIAEVPPGHTLLRVHFQWGFGGETSPLYGAMVNTRTAVQAFGLVTVVHGTAVPNAITARNDQAPPKQRWIYWETRSPVVGGLDLTGGGVVSWRDSGGGGELSSKGQVANTASGTTTSVDLYASWAAQPSAWDASGEAHVWFWASALYT